MAQIGQFTRTPSGYSGHVRTLTLDAELTFVPAENAEAENAPAYRIHLGDEDGPEVGAGWKHSGERAGPFVSVLLDDPALRVQARGLWDELIEKLSDGRSSELAARLEALLLALGEWLHAEESAQARLGGFVAQVVASWDAKGVVERLELQVGKDLQFIRVNGTLVGGLVGLAIFAVSRALGLQ